MEHTKTSAPKKRSAKSAKIEKSAVSWSKSFKTYWQLYLMLIPVLAYFIIFKFWPMYGVQIAFRNYSPAAGFWKSEWVGFDHFKQFFNSYSFEMVLSNTLILSLYLLVVSFPAPVLLALLLNEIQNKHFKKTLQTVTYAPHFLSTVVMVSMIYVFVDPENGIVNTAIQLFGGESKDFISDPEWFRHLYVISDVWKGAGWGSIIYLSTLSGISPTLYEAARIDGASRLKQLWHITLPSLAPTIVLMLIMDCGRIMNVGFEKVMLMQNYLNVDASEVISTFVYKMGIGQMQFSYSTAIDLFNSVVNLVMLLVVNGISRKFSESSLF